MWDFLELPQILQHYRQVRLRCGGGDIIRRLFQAW
jgi:hypothetical protein